MQREDVSRAVLPLRLVFWGGVICVIDINIASGGVRFDIVNDALGMLLITIGVFALASVEVHDRYAGTMAFVKVMSVLALIEAVLSHIAVRGMPTALVVAQVLLALASLAAIVAFCVAMRWLCEAAPLDAVAASWRTTTILYVVIYVIPLGLFYGASLIAIILRESFHVDLGPAGLMLVPVFLVPLVHFFVSTSRMAHAAELTDEGV